MNAATTSKKRKRDPDDTQKVSFALSDQPLTQLGPVLGECRWSSQSKLSVHAKPVHRTASTSQLPLYQTHTIHLFQMLQYTEEEDQQ